MYDREFGISVTIGKGTKASPELIEGLTVQCKNCGWWGGSGHCGVMPSEIMDPESWCATACPKQFFKPKKVNNGFTRN